VNGIERFREHFRGFDHAYVLIGGAACEAWLSSSALTFRRTKDLDIVLVVEALDAAFVERFRQFVESGGYEVRQKPDGGRREFYRFLKPQQPDYPYMLELFSRAPLGVELVPGQTVVRVPLDEGLASLSVILMEEGYYELVLSSRYDADGIPMVGARGLIPLKARAWLDMQRRKAAGGSVDEADIRKHRNDVFRLALTLPGVPGPAIAEPIKIDLRGFLAAFAEGAEDWPAILQALKDTGTRLPRPAELVRAIRTFFDLA